MPRAPTHIRRQVSQAAVPIVLLACLGLSACGNTSSTGTATTAATTTAAATSTATTAAATTSSKPGKQSSTPHFRAAFRNALAAYAACMRHNGVPLPAPDTSGKGPVFKAGSINTASASFKAASTKCQSVLRSALPRTGKR